MSNETINRPGMVSRIVRKLGDSEIAIDKMYKKILPELKIRYSAEVVDEVLAAFLEEIEAILAEGNSIKFNGYLQIKPVYRKEKRANDMSNNTSIIIPAQYRPKIKAGCKLREACSTLEVR